MTMQGVGFEPTKALSHRILSPAHLTALLPLHIKKPIINHIKTFINT